MSILRRNDLHGAAMPDINRLSVLMSAILLAYALTPFMREATQTTEVRLPGIAAVVSLLAAGMAAVGMEWLLSDHPHRQAVASAVASKRGSWRHGLIPALTAWGIGIPLNVPQVGPEWWIVFALGGLLLGIVFVAEYISVDFNDPRYALAMVTLIGVSFALFLVLAIALRTLGARLYLLAPALGLAAGLVALRTLYLRQNGRWCLAWAAGIAWVVVQAGVGLHYLDVAPLSFGLMLLGPAYALTSLASAVEDRRPWRVLWIEPMVMLAAFWLLAVVLL
jgi:hypothetical protein